MGNIEQKQNTSFETGYYHIKSGQNSYLCHNNTITSEVSSDCMFYIERCQSQVKDAGRYFLKKNEGQFWLGQEYNWKKHDTNWSMARVTQWHFFELEPNSFVISTHKIRYNLLLSEYQALTLLEDQNKTKQVVLRKLESDKNKGLNQRWTIKKVSQTALKSIHENNSEVIGDLSQDLNLSKLATNWQQQTKYVDKSSLKERQKTCRITIDKE